MHVRTQAHECKQTLASNTCFMFLFSYMFSMLNKGVIVMLRRKDTGFCEVFVKEPLKGMSEPSSSLTVTPWRSQCLN